MDLQPIQCLIFDLDGTLVDSEPLCAQSYLDILPDLDIPLPALIERFRGWRFADTVLDLQVYLGRQLPPDFEPVYRARVDHLLGTQLKAFEGVHDLLDTLNHPMCIASSGPQAKITRSLSVTKLTSYFAPHIFSAYDIGSWKPEPDLFLHASKQMNVLPEHCLVIEDSEVGISAAQAAGMSCLLFDPLKHSTTNQSSFHHFNELLGIIENKA